MSLIPLARVISFISSPIIVIGLSLFYVIFRSSPDITSASSWFFLSVALIGLAPSLYILLAKRGGHIKDIRLSERQDRFGPFIVACLGIIITILVFYRLDAHDKILLFLMSGLIILLIAAIVTLFWKISIHSAAITSIVMTMNMLSAFSFWPLFALPILVMWSRVALRRHTLSQVVAGAGLSTAVVYIVYSLYGYGVN